VQEIEQEIREFVKENFLIGQDGAVLEGNTSFLDNGLIDSTGVLELVNFMENRYGIKVADEELIPDNLDSINQLVGFITRKTGKNAA
jgi:acyl carrier protein